MLHTIKNNSKQIHGSANSARDRLCTYIAAVVILVELFAVPAVSYSVGFNPVRLVPSTLCSYGVDALRHTKVNLTEHRNPIYLAKLPEHKIRYLNQPNGT